ncbi:MAG: hypothetical protein KDI88_14195 [Gammaproteobacteria bacterium]|nr:hypothetical protein [Gammaproteobacteria bacterium]
MSSKRENERKILSALENSAHRWRTAKGLAGDTGLPLKAVESCLEQSPAVIRSRKAGSHGQALYATREKRPADTAGGTPETAPAAFDDSTREHLRYLALLPLDSASQRLRDTIDRVIREQASQANFPDHALAGAAWIDQITRLMRASDIVVADITRKNPNVIFELGIAHGLGKPLILLLSENADTDFPTNLAGYQLLTYDPHNLSPFAERLGRTARHLEARRGATS